MNNLILAFLAGANTAMAFIALLDFDFFLFSISLVGLILSINNIDIKDHTGNNDEL